MTTMMSQITSLTVVYSTVYSDVDQRKHQNSASLAFVWGIHRDRWIPHTKGLLRGKCFHLMTSSWMSLLCSLEGTTMPQHAIYLSINVTNIDIWTKYHMIYCSIFNVRYTRNDLLYTATWDGLKCICNSISNSIFSVSKSNQLLKNMTTHLKQHKWRLH